MSNAQSLRNPHCEFALTMDDLLNHPNYDTVYLEDEMVLPFILIEGKEVRHDAFLFSTNTTAANLRLWTWNTMEGDSDEGLDLRKAGVIPYPDGTWSTSYVVANNQAFKLIAHLLSK